MSLIGYIEYGNDDGLHDLLSDRLDIIDTAEVWAEAEANYGGNDETEVRVDGLDFVMVYGMNNR